MSNSSIHLGGEPDEAIVAFDHAGAAWTAWWAIGLTLSLIWFAGGLHYLRRAKLDYQQQQQPATTKPKAKPAKCPAALFGKQRHDTYKYNKRRNGTSSRSEFSFRKRFQNPSSSPLATLASPGYIYGTLLASVSRHKREAHDRRVQEDAAALEGGGGHAQFGGLRGWVALCYEMPSFMSLCFLQPAAWNHDLFDETVQEYWISLGSSFQWNLEAYVMGAFGLYATLLAMVLILERCGRNDHPLLRVLVFDILLIRIVSSSVSLLSCSYSSVSPNVVLIALPGVVCWSGRHWFYAAVAIVLLTVEYFAALRHALVTRNQRRPAFRFSVRFNIVFVMGKVLVTTVSMGFRHAARVGLVLVLIAMVTLLLFNARMQPCRGRGRYANNLRACTFATTAWVALCGLVSLYRPNAATIASIVGAPVVTAIAWRLNDRLASRVAIPGSPIFEILGSRKPYVQEVACASLALSKHRPKLSVALLSRLSAIVNDASNSDRTRLWASLSLLQSQERPLLSDQGEARLSKKDSSGRSPAAMLARSVKSSRVLPVLGVDIGDGESERKVPLSKDDVEERVSHDARAFAVAVVNKNSDGILRARAALAICRLYRASSTHGACQKVGVLCWLTANLLRLVAVPCVSDGDVSRATEVRDILVAFVGTNCLSRTTLTRCRGEWLDTLQRCYEVTVTRKMKKDAIVSYKNFQESNATLDAVGAVLESFDTLLPDEFTSSTRRILSEFVETLVDDRAVFSSHVTTQKYAEKLLRRAKHFVADYGRFDETFDVLTRADKLRGKIDRYAKIAFSHETLQDPDRVSNYRQKIINVVQKEASSKRVTCYEQLAIILCHIASVAGTEDEMVAQCVAISLKGMAMKTITSQILST